MTNKTIIHLDDDKDLTTLINGIIEKFFPSVHYEPIHTKASFLSRITTSKPDLVLLDINLDEGEGEGFKLIKKIKQKSGDDTTVIMMSGRSGMHSVSFGLWLGADDYIIKPFDIKNFVSILQSHLENDFKSRSDIFKVREAKDGSLSLKLTPHMIDESFIYFRSPFYIVNQTKIVIRHEYLFDIFGKSEVEFLVHDCETLTTSKEYILKLSPFQNQQMAYDAMNTYLLKVSNEG